MAKKKTRNFGDLIRAKLAANPELARAVEVESFNADIAQQVYNLRLEAKLTQKQLAVLVDTQQSVISRIEDADYDGHSLTMLKRIARALNRRLKVDFCAKPIHSTNEVIEFALKWETARTWEAVFSGICSMDVSNIGAARSTRYVPVTPLNSIFFSACDHSTLNALQSIQASSKNK